MTRLQLGGWGPLTGANIKQFVPNMEVAAVVVFAGSTAQNLYRDRDSQIQLAQLRKMLLDEYV
jgi:hypothetical protein